MTATVEPELVARESTGVSGGAADEVTPPPSRLHKADAAAVKVDKVDNVSTSAGKTGRGRRGPRLVELS